MQDVLDNPAFLVVGIFVARVIDVSLGTLRTILVFRGHKYRAAIIGFFEVLVWVFAASKVIQNLDSWYLALSYAGGFAAGNILGSYLESKLAIGTELVRAVSQDKEVNLAERLSGDGYSVIELEGKENDAPVEVLLVVEKRKNVPKLLRAIDETDPEAFYTISDVKEHEKNGRDSSERALPSAKRK